MKIATPSASDRRGGVVYVDDVEPLVRMTTRMLAALGYEPHGFTSAEVALPFVTEHAGDLSAVIADRSMPGMGGLEFLDLLNGLSTQPRLILATALHAPSQLAQYRRPGIAAVLAKPFTMEDLVDALAGAGVP